MSLITIYAMSMFLPLSLLGASVFLAYKRCSAWGWFFVAALFVLFGTTMSIG